MSEALTVAQKLRVYAATCPSGGKVELILEPDSAIALAVILERIPETGYFVIEREKPISRFEQVTYAANWAFIVMTVAGWLGWVVMP